MTREQNIHQSKQDLVGFSSTGKGETNLEVKHSDTHVDRKSKPINKITMIVELGEDVIFGNKRTLERMFPLDRNNIVYCG